MKNLSLYVFLILTAFTICSWQASAQNKSLTSTDTVEYKGTPFIDSISAFSIQTLPGKLKCAFYDFGGEGISYHDSDDKNSGSGGLNKGPGYLNNFRIHEAVDISYTKYHDSVDNSIYNKVQPEINQLYLGWTEPGEWTKYTVEVSESANYRVGVMYTSNRGGAIRFFVDNVDSTSLLDIPSTFDAREPLAWRQWHHWNYIDSLTIMHLKKGRRVIKLEISKLGNLNFDYFDFQNIP
jgi:hypothetical protein